MGELNQVQQEIVRRISEKEEEFVLIKKNYSKAVENMQSALETEAKAKAEALRMQSLIDQMQSKIKSYKKQIEEAEEIAALNLAKYRQVQSALGVAEERADMSEQALARVRTRARSASLGPM